MRIRGFLAIIAFLSLVAMPAKADITSNLVGHWEFDDGIGTNALDSVSANNGTLGLYHTPDGGVSIVYDGACADVDVCPYWTTGIISGGVELLGFITNGTFDGGGAIEIPTVGNYDGLNDNYTMSLWFRMAEDSRGGQLFSNWRYGVFEGIELSIGDPNAPYNNVNAMSFRVDSQGNGAGYCDPSDIGGVGGYLTLNSTINDGEWHNAVWIRDSLVLKVYVDGQLEFADENCIASTNTTIGENLLVGWGLGSPINDWVFNGTVDDFRIYNRVLSGSDVIELYGDVPATTTTTTTTISGVTQTLGDIGTGVGGLLDGIGAPLAVFVILISVASAVGFILGSIGKGVGKKV